MWEKSLKKIISDDRMPLSRSGPVRKEMATIHAVLFFFLGVIMWFAPAVVPGFFPPSHLDGANTSALWLQLMGWLNGSIGICYLTHFEIVPFLRQSGQLLLQLDEEVVATGILRPVLSLEALMQIHGEPEWRAIG